MLLIKTQINLSVATKQKNIYTHHKSNSVLTVRNVNINISNHQGKGEEAGSTLHQTKQDLQLLGEKCLS